MSAADWHARDLVEVAARLRLGDLDAESLVTHMLARIEALEPELRAYVCVLAERALEQAHQADQRRRLQGPDRLPPLHGVPVAIKDLLQLDGTATTAGMPLLAANRPQGSATVAARLEAAGAILQGKLKLTEGAYGVHHPDIDPPLNPWHADLWTGVSSSGTGVAVAAGLCFGGIGTDTGGSIRFPSAACGVVGLKPTRGRVSLHGVMPLAPKLDHVGPMTRSVADAAAMFTAIAGHDPLDPDSVERPVSDWNGALRRPVRGMRIGWDDDFNETGLTADVRWALHRARDWLLDAGARLVPMSLPAHAELVDGWALACAVETAIVHARWFRDHPEAYGPAFAALVRHGQSARAEDYARIWVAARRFRHAFELGLREVDVLLTVSQPRPTRTLQAMEQALGDPEDSRVSMQFTAPFDFSGHPTLSMPMGMDDRGYPLSLQLVGSLFDEASVLAVGAALEVALRDVVEPAPILRRSG